MFVEVVRSVPFFCPFLALGGGSLNVGFAGIALEARIGLGFFGLAVKLAALSFVIPQDLSSVFFFPLPLIILVVPERLKLLM